MITSYGTEYGGYTRTASNAEALSFTGLQAITTGVWPAWWLGTATGGTGGTGEGTAAVTEGGAGIMAGVSTTPIPVSWGQRRIIAAIIDKIVKPIGVDGFGSEILDASVGKPLFRDVPNDLSMVVANGTVVYDVLQGGVIHPALASVVWYDGTSDAQIQDPTFVAEYGAEFVPGYVGIMHAILDFNTYAPWNGGRPGITLFVTDSGHGTIFSPWRGSLDEEVKDASITLSDEDMTATAVGGQGTVLGTFGFSTGRRAFAFDIGSANIRIGLAKDTANLSTDLGSPDDKSFSWNSSGNLFIAGVGAGAWISYGSGDQPILLVDLTERMVWGTLDGIDFYGNTSFGVLTEADVVAGNNGLDISHANLAGELFPALDLESAGNTATAAFDINAFLSTPPGDIGMVNWGDVFMALAPLCNLPSDKIETIDITAESEGGVLYGGLSWSQAILNSGKLENIDFWEDADQIYIKQTDFDPVADVGEVPAKHRYILSEDQGSIAASRGGEPRKPSVVELSYYDTTRQFQLSMVPARSEVHDSVTVDRITTFWVMTAAAAADRSAIALGKTEMEFQEFNHELPPIVPYVQIRPADIVFFDEEGIETRTMVKSWSLETDWTVKTEYKFLYRSVQPEIPLTLETVDPSLPAWEQPSDIILTEP